jgi:hypothetical protein
MQKERDDKNAFSEKIEYFRLKNADFFQERFQKNSPEITPI